MSPNEQTDTQGGTHPQYHQTSKHTQGEDTTTASPNEQTNTQGGTHPQYHQTSQHTQGEDETK